MAPPTDPAFVDAHHLSSHLTRTVLGIDRLYRERQADAAGPLDREGLVPVHWSPLEPAPVDSWRRARRLLADLLVETATLPDPWARDWLTEQALALLTLVRWLSGEDLSYERVVAGALRVDPRPPTPAQLQRLRQARERALRRAGFASYAAYREADEVAPHDLAPTLETLLAAAEARTRARLPTLRLPQARIGVELVSDVPYSAYCDYPGRAMWLNADLTYTRAGLKQLVAHEAYPGHYTHMGHRDALEQRGAALPDTALVVTNSASSVLFEGIAERGLELLNWRDTPTDAVAWWHNRLQWLAAIEAAHALNSGRASEREVAAFLREQCDADDAWIHGKLRFVTHALRAPFVYSYWWGGTVVGRWLKRVPATRLDDAVGFLYDRLHSPTTLAAHWKQETP